MLNIVQGYPVPMNWKKPLEEKEEKGQDGNKKNRLFT